MKTETISIEVDSAAASAYRAATDDDRRKLDLLLSLRIAEATRSATSLEDILVDIARMARSRGLTTEALESILDGR